MLFLWTIQIKTNAHSNIFDVTLSVAGEPIVRFLFRNSNDQALCRKLNHENILLPLWCCQLSLFDEPESLLPVAQLILLQSKLDRRFDLHQQFWKLHRQPPGGILFTQLNTTLRDIHFYP
ncbi:hypothetical protein TNCT_198631 [Trichonephila clavata]|uniref:Uncharacterized protein n=1 Tax=Trichonephila clavata TaxID=2740835 RepID=A0A8X6GFL2_TRICU|nr:hypothetical protein TNCT_198631 [Trichonephila clavata]